MGNGRGWGARADMDIADKTNLKDIQPTADNNALENLSSETKSRSAESIASGQYLKTTENLNV